MASTKRWEMDGYIQNSVKPTAAVPAGLQAQLDGMAVATTNFTTLYPSLQKIASSSGWSPVLTLVEHRDARLLRVADWTGGVGEKPAVGGYVGQDGLVTDMDWAIDVRGPAGAKGSPGAAGATGAQGPEGPAGSAGPQGSVGPQGVAGPKGDTGAEGPRGVPGEAGAQGSAGQRGEQGAQGIPGPAGAAGAAGPQGVQGNTGEAGPQGPMGPKGEQGTIGLTGLKGDTGSQGPAGPTGPSALVKLGSITINETATIAITAGIRTLTRTGITGLLAGDNVLLVPTAALPAGYAIHNAVATANGTLQITLNAPLLAIGASYSIVCRVEVLR